MLTLIADSGSTKTDWVLIDRKNVLSNLKTIGFNPYFQTKDQISLEIKEHLKPFLGDNISKIEHIYYYGAGCSNEANCKIVLDGIHKALELKNIDVHHDLLAAARALCGQNPGIACILGTGSNSCLYDGKHVIENVPSVGYLFGDHGSGAHIGMNFIQAYFDNELPKKIRDGFEKNGYHREEILNNVYKKPMPSRYLASINKFVSENIKDVYVRNLVKKCFISFFHKQIWKYSNSREYTVNSVGSVGFYYKDILAEVANEEGYKLGKVIKSPIDGLIEYHQSLL
jgi:N-acetylglucosamine kinase-like BadF-type ATPase